MSFSFNTPVGRFIQGSLTEKGTTDHQNRPIAPDKQRFFFGIAVRKDDPAVGALINGLIGMVFASEYQSKAPHVLAKANEVLQAGFPSGNTGFSWKIADGDKPDSTGQPNENSRGCWIFKFTSSFPIKCCNQQNAEISPDQIKRGYYVDVSGNSTINGNTDGTAGIYLNPQWVRLVAFGQEIVGGPTAAQAFANTALPTALPPGASATPLPGMSAGVAGGGMASFGQQLPQNPAFGQQQPQNPAFGQQQPQNPAFGQQQPQNPAFGQQQPQNPAFGQQQPQNPAFGQQQPQNPAFGQQQPQNPAFGQQQPQNPAFGQQQPQNPAFGQQQPQNPAFGQQQPQNPAFGQQQAAALPGFTAPNTNGGSTTGYPINPRTGQPVQPHTGFIPQP